jgi:predicted enzyme related to lactoylglutathione lyase
MVVLMERDMDAAVAFYEAMGALKHTVFPGSWAEMVIGDVTVALCHTETDYGPRRTGLVFAVKDLLGFYAAHKDTYQFMHEPVTKLHGIMASIQDPSGNVIELYQPTPEKVREYMDAQKEESGCCKEDKPMDEGCCKKQESPKTGCC